MPTHDWTRVAAGVFHDFHHAWTSEISRRLNGGVLPPDYYALLERHAHGFTPDAPVELTAEGEMEFYSRKQKSVVVRSVSGDEVVAIVEVVSPANKATQHWLSSFVRKACELFDRDIHLMVLDLHPPGPRDLQGIHGAIWDEFTGQVYESPPDRPITLAAYECDLSVRAYVQHRAVGDTLPAMPLFLLPRAYGLVPLEETYNSAFDAVPQRWRSVLE
jgi:hypothetical protein